jgi:gluconolactonase
MNARSTSLIIQDMQNDVVSAGGAFEASGALEHARQQNVVENLARLAHDVRAKDGTVIHVWYLVHPGAPGMKLNAPLFEDIRSTDAMVRGTWGGEPVPGLVPQDGDFVVEKMRMNPFYCSSLEAILRGVGAETVITAGALTNLAVEHTARHAADGGFRVVVPSDGTATFSSEWQRVAIEYTLPRVSTIMTCAEITAAMR